jgi:RNA polymerase sigma-70 factor, ECF subfamily
MCVCPMCDLVSLARIVAEQLGCRDDRMKPAHITAAQRPECEPSRQLDPDSLANHVARLYRAAYGLCGSRQDAEDLVQDTYERVLRRPRFVRRDGDLAYLMKVMRNTWISSRRTARVLTVPAAGEEIEQHGGQRDPIAESIDAAPVYEALCELSRPLREAVVAVDVIGLSYRDAARALGTKQGTIMSRVSRGRGQIAARLLEAEQRPDAPESKPSARGTSAAALAP